MFTREEYELLDFGDGRKLERFAGIVVDRPAPAAEGLRRGTPAIWSEAHARYVRSTGETGRWTWRGKPPAEWTIHHGELAFALKCSDAGQVGIFPEQAESWDWIARRVQSSTARLNVLNLFAYTGGSTLAAAQAGASVTHVDAAKTSVAAARRNAELSGLADAPIRWIVEDALKFVERELKRGRSYDAVILDPPSYGHGPGGEPWKIHVHLAKLLSLCAELTAESRRLVLVTCHTPGIGPAELNAYLADNIFGHCGAGGSAGELALRAADGRALPSAVYARWP